MTEGGRHVQVRSAVAAVAALLPPRVLEPAVVAWWERHPEARLGVGVSGGVDSVVLLHALAGIPSVARRLVVLHFDHALRGRESERDAEFVAALAQDLGLPLVSERWAEAARPAIPDEAAAREARLSFFARASRACGLRAVMLAHHADDVAETLLQRLARGSGVEGLCGPRPVQIFAAKELSVLRPVLGVTRERLIAVAQRAAILWREDRSNAGRQHERNRLRLDVMPALDLACGRAFSTGATSARRALEADHEALEWAAEELLRRLERVGPDGGAPFARVLQEVPGALRVRVVRRWLTLRLGDSKFAASVAEKVIEASLGPAAKPLRVSSEFVLVFEGGDIFLESMAVDATPTWAGQRVRAGGALAGADGGLVQTSLVALKRGVFLRLLAASSSPERQVVVDASCAGPELEIRSWRPGDRYRCLGAAGSAKVQDHFQNRGVPWRRRRRLPVVCGHDGRILWIPGLPPAHDARLTEASRVALQLTYRCPPAP